MSGWANGISKRRSRIPHDLPRAALARRRGDAAPLSGLPTFGRLCGTELHLDRRVLRLGCIHHSPCRSSGTSSGATDLVKSSRSTIRGAMAILSSGRPAVRRHATTSPSPYPLRVSGVRDAPPTHGGTDSG